MSSIFELRARKLSEAAEAAAKDKEKVKKKEKGGGRRRIMKQFKI